MSTKQRTATTRQNQAIRPNSTELTEADLDKVNGGIIGILVGKSSQATTPVFQPPGPNT